MDRSDNPISQKTVSRRDFAAMAALLGGISLAGPASAQGFRDIMGSAKKVIDAVSYSDADMRVFFDQMSDDMDSKNPVAGPDNPYAQRLAALSQGLESHDGLDLDIKAYLVKDVNAFAMANGTIRIFAGLMDQFTDDEVRYVIGHEIGHVQREHTKKRMQGALQRDAAMSVAGNASGDVRRIASTELGKFFGDVIGAQHSQKHERQADDYALEFMQEKGYDEQACVTALEKLQALSGGGDNALAAWTATHPSPKARAKRLRKKID